MAVFLPKRGGCNQESGALGGLASGGPDRGNHRSVWVGWIFFVNLLCLIGLVMVLLFVPETSDPQVSKALRCFSNQADDYHIHARACHY